VTEPTSYVSAGQLVVLSSTSRAQRDRRLDGLIDRLPTSLRVTVRWLRLPTSRWVRIPAGLLLVTGGVFSILPFLGIWMLPLGVVLLADDVPPLRRITDKVLDRVERRRPHWFVQPAR
jgi:hypothetical protein